MEDGIEFWFPESIEYRMMQYFWCIIRNYILVCSVYFSTVMVFTFVIVFAFIAHNSKRLSRITYRLLTQYTSFRLVLMGNFMGICNDSGWMWVRKGTGMLWHYTLNIFLFVNLELKFNPRPHPEFELYLLTIKYHASQYYFVFFRCSYSESLSVFMTWQNTGGFDPKWKRKHEKKKSKEIVHQRQFYISRCCVREMRVLQHCLILGVHVHSKCIQNYISPFFF